MPRELEAEALYEMVLGETVIRGVPFLKISVDIPVADIKVKLSGRLRGERVEGDVFAWAALMALGTFREGEFVKLDSVAIEATLRRQAVLTVLYLTGKAEVADLRELREIVGQGS